ELRVFEAGRLSAEAHLERDRRHEAEVRRRDVRDLCRRHVTAPRVAAEVAVEDLHLLFELWGRPDNREGEEQLFPLLRLFVLRPGDRRPKKRQEDTAEAGDGSLHGGSWSLEPRCEESASGEAKGVA